MRGRPPKPTAVLEITGAAKKNPQRIRARANEPKPEGPLGAPPEHWKNPCSIKPGAREAIWNEIVAEAPPGVLTISDRKLVEIICELTYESRLPYSKGQLRARVELAKLLPKLGMNPCDRARMNVQGAAPAQAEQSKLSAFVSRKRA